LALNVGGTGEFTTGDVTTLLNNLGGANGSNTEGFEAGSTIAFDTTNASGNAFTIADTIANTTGSGGGAVGLTKLGNNTLVLEGNNTFTGNTKINAGNLQIGNGSTTGSLSASSAISNNGTLTFNRTDTVTQGSEFSSAGITGTGSLTQNGTGTLVLNANNTYTGATTINSGTLQLGSGGTSGSLSSSSAVVNYGTLSINRSDIVTQGSIFSSAAISGTGNISQDGTGTLVLNAANTYNGTTLLNAGTLAINNNTAIGSGILRINGGTIDNTSGSAISLSNNNAQIWNGDFSFAGTGDLNLGTGAVTMNASRALNVISRNLTVGGAIAGSTYGLTKNGNGTLILSGNNTYTGMTRILGGMLQLAKTGSLYNGSNANWLASNIRVASGSVLAFNVGGTNEFSTSNVTILLNNLGGANGSSAGGFEAGSTIAFDTTNASGSNFTIADSITDTSGSGGGSLALTKLGTNVLILTGNNSFTGDTKINAGTLQLGNGGTTGSLSSSGVISNNGTLTFNRTNTVTQGADFSAAAITGTGNLTQNGTGTVVLNANNTYSGATTVNGGTLSINSIGNGGNASAIGSSSNASANLVLGNATLLYTGENASTNRNFILTTGTNTTIDISNNATTLTLSGTSTGTTGGITKNGTGRLVLSGANSYSGYTVLNAGTLALNNNSAIGSSIFRINGGTIDNTSVSAKTININSQIWNGDFTFAGSNDLSLGAINSTVNMTASRILNVSAGNLTISGNIFGTNSTLTKNGSGTLILTGTNSYTGNTTVSGGMLQFTKSYSLYNGATANWTASKIKIASGGTLALNVGVADEFTTGNIQTFINNVVAGGGFAAGSTLALDTTNASAGTFTLADALYNGAGNSIGLKKLGTNILILTGGNSYTGATTIEAGTLQIGSGGTIGSLATTSSIINNGTLLFNRSDTVTQGSTFSSNGITGTGNLTKNGTGTLVLNAANTYNGSTTLNTGTLVINNNGAIGNGTLIINGGTIDNTSGSAKTLTNNNSQTWASSFTFLGTGNLDLGSGNVSLTTSPAITVNSGNLTVGGNITGSGYSLSKAGSGNLTLTGLSSYTGSTTVNGTGALSINSMANSGTASSIGSSGGLVMGGGTLIYTGGNAVSNRSLEFSTATSSIISIANSTTTLNMSSTTTSGAGNFLYNGTGRLDLSMGHTGTTTISSGTLGYFGGGGATGAITLNGTATLLLNNSSYLGNKILNV
jgi:autotransporter-associated beta strand protein